MRTCSALGSFADKEMYNCVWGAYIMKIKLGQEYFLEEYHIQYHEFSDT